MWLLKTGSTVLHSFGKCDPFQTFNINLIPGPSSSARYSEFLNQGGNKCDAAIPIHQCMTVQNPVVYLVLISSSPNLLTFGYF